MAFADPQSVTIAGVTTSLPRVSTEKNGSKYQSSDGLIDLSAAHTYGAKRNRHVLRLDHAKISADPFIPAQNVRIGMSTYLVTDVPIVGYTLAQQLEVYEGLELLITASSSALVSKVLGGES